MQRSEPGPEPDPDPEPAAGVTGVEIVDSRRIRSLWCCSQAVLIGRHDSKQAAVAQERALAKQGFADILVRELY